MQPAFGGMEGSGANRGCVRWLTAHSLGQDPALGGHSGAETKGIEVEAVERLGPQTWRVCVWISEASGLRNTLATAWRRHLEGDRLEVD